MNMKITKIRSSKRNTDNITQRLSNVERYLATHRGDVKAKSQAEAFTPSTTGAVYYVSNISQSDTAEGRTGDVINAHNFTLGVRFKMTASCSVRIILVRDTQQQGAIPAVSDILDSGDVISPLNYVNTVAQKRFIVLEDYTKHFTVGGVETDTHRRRLKFNHKMRWVDSSGAATSARANNLYAVVISDTGTAGTVSLYTRLEFTDE